MVNTFEISISKEVKPLSTSRDPVLHSPPSRSRLLAHTRADGRCRTADCGGIDRMKRILVAVITLLAATAVAAPSQADELE